MRGHLQQQRWENHIPLIRSYKQQAVWGSDEATAATGTYTTGHWRKKVISDMAVGNWEMSGNFGFMGKGDKT